MKSCISCQRVKPLAAFYQHPKMADGHLNKCKECCKTAAKINRLVNIDRYKEHDRQRADMPRRVAAREAYKQTERGKDRGNIGKKAWIDRNPEARAAHIIVGNALRDGRLKRSACRICGNASHHAHHNDYSKPLDVWWLCRDCHKTLHSKAR